MLLSMRATRSVIAFLALIMAAQFLSVSLQTQAAEHQTTVLKFPRDRAIGKLFWCDGKPNDVCFNENVHSIGPALGDVTVPANTPIIINLRQDSHIDEVFEALSHLSANAIQRLECHGCPVTDADIDKIGNLTGLVSINASGSAITDKGVALLVAHHPRLVCIALSKTAISDRSCAELAKLKNLLMVDLTHTQVSDQGAKDLVGCRKLVRLLLNFTHITSASAVSLRSMSSLHALCLEGTHIGDAGVIALSSMKNLLALNLEADKLSPTAIHALENMSRLEILSILPTTENRRAIEELKRKMPKLQVHVVEPKKMDVDRLVPSG